MIGTFLLDSEAFGDISVQDLEGSNSWLLQSKFSQMVAAALSLPVGRTQTQAVQSQADKISSVV